MNDMDEFFDEYQREKEIRDFKHTVIVASFTDDMGAQLEKMEVKEDDLLFIKVPKDYARDDFMASLLDQLSYVFPHYPTIITPEVDIKAMSIQELIELRNIIDEALEDRSKGE